ncbi:hypothetical protein JG479_17690 [Pseudoalteromonas sp. LC2018020214]|uniref:hypothetical protein n=1 Tax=Pseudoalteromonas sp. LC2018020214 TaxID=2799564 RepID=UPI0019058FB3|nr:hypothetical protein [Pseudoalteromonas sp. LC2018020214]QQM66420.1 hypothetical protein JG479_17690 [Pseudoalteromonas sp. LC2018020214]
MKPIIIDAATIFDPARLLAVLASVDIRHSEVWVSQRYDHFKEKDFLTGWGTDSRFALLPDSKGKYKCDPLGVPLADEKLPANSDMTGPKILRWALDKGMVVVKDLYKYEELAIELENQYKLNDLSEAIMLGPPHEYDLRAGKERTEEFLQRSGKTALGPEYAWRLEPYGIGHGLGLILAAAQEDNVEPFLSHPYFKDNVSTHNYSFYKKDEALKLLLSDDVDNSFQIIEVEKTLKDAKRLLKTPESLKIAEIAYYLNQKERIDTISGLITASEQLETRNKDCGIIATKYVGTLTTDLALFGGIPITSTLTSIYDVGTRFFKSSQ